MNQPDFEGAKQYALRRLKNELAPELYYHNLAHTRDGVLPAVMKFATQSGINEQEKLLLEVAAAFHDIGFVVQRTEHELAGCKIAAQVLPNFGFSQAQIEAIVGMIMATRLPQTPHNLLEEILADADLDVLGRTEDFFSRNQLLRLEMAINGQPATQEEWYRGQLKFLEGHRYFTQAARSVREAGKHKIIAELKKRVMRRA